MRFLAAENIFPKIIRFLRSLGHNVKGIQELDLFQITDDEFVEIAIKEKRTVITFDKHFGDILRQTCPV